MIDRIAPRFARYERLRHAGELMAEIVSGLDRRNCWTIAEHRGDATPDGLQHLLARAKWDADGVRDDLCDGAFARDSGSSLTTNPEFIDQTYEKRESPPIPNVTVAVLSGRWAASTELSSPEARPAA